MLSRVNLSNMVAFNQQGLIQRYASCEQIIDEFYPIRRQLYKKRKQHMVSCLEKELQTVSQKFKFVSMVSTKQLDFRDLSKAQMV